MPREGVAKEITGLKVRARTRLTNWVTSGRTSSTRCEKVAARIGLRRVNLKSLWPQDEDVGKCSGHIFLFLPLYP